MKGSRHERGRRVRARLVPLVVSLTVIAALAGVVRLMSVSGDDGPSLEGPVLASVQRTELEPSVSVTLRAQVVPGGELLATGGGAWVSEVFVTSGDTVQEGDEVYSLDGISVVAAATAFPLGRPLDVGAVGPDVKELERFLTRQGLFDGTADQTFTGSTGRAVHELGHEVGVSDTSRFDPRWLVHIPDTTVTLSEIAIEPATPAPSTGAVWARQPDRVSDTTVNVPVEWVPVGRDSEYELVAGDVTMQARLQEDPPQLVLIDGQQSALRSLAADQAPSRSNGSSGQDRNTATGPTAVRQLEVSMSARPQQPVEGIVVPVSAVVTDNDGRTCVAVADGREARSWQWVEVAVVGSQPGLGAYLPPDALPTGESVLLDPDPPPGLRCD